MKKEEFKQKTRDVLDELADYITKLEDKAGEIAKMQKKNTVTAWRISKRLKIICLKTGRI
jgi:hypothetical protein